MTSKELPILFNGAMVRAILSGAKTQTRRVMKPQPEATSSDYPKPGHTWPSKAHQTMLHVEDEMQKWIGLAGDACPFGQPGDRLRVRESFRIGEYLGEDWESGMDAGDRFPIYQADGEHGSYGVVPLDWDPPRNACEVHNSEGTAEHWRSFGPISSTQMPRWACRLVLEITDVRVEQLQAISKEDAAAEGLHRYAHEWGDCEYPLPDIAYEAWEGAENRYSCPRHGFRDLWLSTGGDWDNNPWVWVISFKRVEVA